VILHVLMIMMNDTQFSTLREPIAVVVDDEPLILMGTSEMISEAGYTVVEATSADEAYSFLKQHHSVQLVFTDVQMPGKLDGFDLARKVADNWPQICIIVASGASTPREGDLPANVEFLSKPFSKQTVEDVLRERCPRHPS
jgi:CheY-like chemotaxis protein